MNKPLREAFIRLFVLLIISLIAHLIAVIFLIVILINIIVTIFNKKPIKELINFSRAGFNEIVKLSKYLLFISNERPFPFNELKANSNL
ncbi:MAG: DUF4389 domain-containing protein [Nanoarchaeota archaeon]